MKYTEEFFIDLKKRVNVLLKFLQECRYSGSYETKLDLNTVIKLIANQDFVIDQLRTELKNLEKEKSDANNKIKELEKCQIPPQ
jgi:hypothetical protein